MLLEAVHFEAMGPDSWSTQTLMRHNRRDDRGRVGKTQKKLWGL